MPFFFGGEREALSFLSIIFSLSMNFFEEEERFSFLFFSFLFFSFLFPFPTQHNQGVGPISSIIFTHTL